MSQLHPAARDLGIPDELLIPFGRDKAKVHRELLARPSPRAAAGSSARPSRLVLVSAITPTPAGEGKTTVSIGLADGLRRLGERVCLALREPSLGPSFGMKGGGTGGGRSELVPSADINLHFTGDLHAVGAAHNLVAAIADNHAHFASDLDLDPRQILWRRVVDINDRALRNIIVGLGGKPHGIPRECGFDITAASEIMAILCLAEDTADLRRRLDAILVGLRRGGAAVTGADLACTGAALALLRDAVHPNLVVTAEGTPAFVHGGPFANIAHGCNSVVATRAALHVADWAITEAGFGFDLGAEKFFDIKCRTTGLVPAAVVLVASIRALAHHGAGDVAAGLPNLDKHIENIRAFGQAPIVALNHFDGDRLTDHALVRDHCAAHDVPFAVIDAFSRGPEGAEDLAHLLLAHAGTPPAPHFLYALDDPVPDKILAVARTMYGARDLAFTRTARRQLDHLEALGYANLPVCIAKTQSSLSDDPARRGRPTDFEVTVRRVEAAAGAGFLVISTGDILRMPGLPRAPRATSIDLIDGEIVGVG